MWNLKILSGSQSGKTFSLQEGVNSLGRGSQNSIILENSQVSKNHAQIIVQGSTIRVVDRNSSNGTFVDGVQVRDKIISHRNKLAFHNVICAIVSHAPVRVSAENNLPSPEAVTASPKNFSEHLQNYVDNVVLPGVYKIPEIIEFKWVLIIFISLFVFFVTVLSSVPMIRIVKDSIQTESQLRSRTITKTLARINRAGISQSSETSLSIKSALSESGVDSAYIINREGIILAPAREAGRYLNLDYVHEGRKLDKGSVSQVNSSTIVAMEPIQVFDPQEGLNLIAAFAVIKYNMGSFSLDKHQTASLLIQNFFIALVLGGLLYFLLYKLFEFPLKKLNMQIDQSIRSGESRLDVKYKFSALNVLCTNIKSILYRALTAAENNSSQTVEPDRFNELSNLVSLMSQGALVIQAGSDEIVMANDTFYKQTGLQSHDLINVNINQVTDQALKLNLQDLMRRVKENPEQFASNALEFNGEDFQIFAQSISGSKDIAYYMIIISKSQGAEMAEEGVYSI